MLNYIDIHFSCIRIYYSYRLEKLIICEKAIQSHSTHIDTIGVFMGAAKCALVTRAFFSIIIFNLKVTSLVC